MNDHIDESVGGSSDVFVVASCVVADEGVVDVVASFVDVEKSSVAAVVVAVAFVRNVQGMVEVEFDAFVAALVVAPVAGVAEDTFVVDAFDGFDEFDRVHPFVETD